MIPLRPSGRSRSFRAARRSAASKGLAETRWLVVAGVAALVVAVAIAKLRNGTDEPAVEDPIDGTAPAVLEEAPDATVQPAAMTEEVIAIVDASRVSETPVASGEGIPDPSHIGPRMDPESELYEPGDASPSHIGEYLDPDDEYVSSAEGEASHIGEYLDPVADE